MKNKQIIGLLGLIMILSLGILGYLYITEKVERVAAEKVMKSLISDIQEQAKLEKEAAKIDIEKREATIDSLNTAYSLLAIKKIQNERYYEKKLSKVKTVNTFARRSSYADSIEVAIRNRHSN